VLLNHFFGIIFNQRAKEMGIRWHNFVPAWDMLVRVRLQRHGKDGHKPAEHV
jgi:hypothetical protein